MPIYEFACEECGHTFEKIRRVSDADTPPCEKCGSTHTAKKMSGFVSRSGGGSSGSSSPSPAPSSRFT